MLDKYVAPKIKPTLGSIAAFAHARGVTADSVSIAGFAVGLCSVVALALGHPLIALGCLLINRLADGIDGEIARIGTPRDSGAYLDITLDFIFYACFPLGFALYAPGANALAAAVLIASFVGTGASFLAFAIHSEKHNIVSPDFSYKGLYYLDGLAEGTETFFCFVLMCLFPKHFATIAWIFASVCAVTAINRVYSGYRTLK